MNDLSVNLSEQEEIEVELASPGSRISAYLLNCVFSILAYIPLIAGFLMNTQYFDRAKGMDSMVEANWNWTWIAIGTILFLIYGVAQIFFMSRDGQSLGKKIMGIRVLKTDGRNPGFVGAVLMREFIYYIIVGLGAAACGMLAQVIFTSEEMVELVANLLQLIASIACFVMLFKVNIDRRTLQDFVADTVVVKLPKNT